MTLQCWMPCGVALCKALLPCRASCWQMAWGHCWMCLTVELLHCSPSCSPSLLVRAQTLCRASTLFRHNACSEASAAHHCCWYAPCLVTCIYSVQTPSSLVCHQIMQSFVRRATCTSSMTPGNRRQKYSVLSTCNITVSNRQPGHSAMPCDTHLLCSDTWFVLLAQACCCMMLSV